MVQLRLFTLSLSEFSISYLFFLIRATSASHHHLLRLVVYVSVCVCVSECGDIMLLTERACYLWESIS